MANPITRRRFTATAALAAGSGVLSACSGAGGSGQTAAPRSRAPFTLEVLVSIDPDKEPWFKETFIPQYQAKVGSQVSVAYNWVDWGKMEDYFGVQKVSGSLQDVIRTGAGPWVWIYAEKQIGLPIDDRVKQWGKREDFFPASYDTLVYQGKTYGLVSHTSPRMYPYRKDVADESGAKILDTWTWDDYMTAAVQINRIQDGKLVRLGASPLNLGWQEYMLIFYSGGGRVTRNGKTAFDGPEGEWALDLALQRKTRLQPEGTGGLPSTNVPVFAGGQAGILYATPGAMRDVERFAPDRIKDVVIPLPPMKAKRVSMVNSDGWTINRDTKHPDEAWEFMKLWFEPAICEKWNEMGYTIPPRKSIASSAAFMQKPHMQRIASNLDKFGVPVPVWPDYTNLFTNLQQELDAAMKREKSVRVALADSGRYWNNVLAQYKWKD